jgi:hypothetical protein
VYDELEYDGAPAIGEELNRRYGALNTFEDDERKSRPRARTQSGVSGRTVSSGTVDPSVRRATFSNGQWPPASSYNNFVSTVAGGVGESPAVLHRADSKRSGFANLFNLGGSTRKTATRPKSNTFDNSSQLPPSRLNVPISRIPPSGELRLAAVEYQPPSPNVRASTITEDEQDDNEYYASLIQAPLQHTHPPIPVERTVSSESRRPRKLSKVVRPLPAPTTPHPYANVYASHGGTPPLSAPLASGFQLNQNTNGTTHSRTPARAPVNKRLLLQPQELKNSVSTPDLRSAAREMNSKALPKGKDRWLSPETWCDALLFPRPRFKMKDPAVPTRRIVSPPGSPLFGNFEHDSTVAPGVTSRVLAHSRSLVDLNKKQEPNPAPSYFNSQTLKPLPIPNIILPRDGSRPKSFAWDDLALPSPIPSLSR